MASPHVAGAVALVAAAFPADTTAARIQRILGHVDPVASLAGKMTTGGRLDVAAAVLPDTTPPVTSAVVLPATPNGLAGWWVTPPEITLTTNEPAETYFRWDADPLGWQVYFDPADLWVDEGTHTLYFYSTDLAANDEAPVKSLTLKTDTWAPFTSDNSDTLPHRSFVLVLSPSDGTSGVASTEYRIDGGDWVSDTSVTLRHTIRHKLAGCSWGAHLVEYRSTDNAGNVEEIKNCTVTLGR